VVSITFSLDDRVFSIIKHIPWVSWSEVGREELRKRKIFEGFIKTGELSAKDQEFCDRIDWYPVDELPLREEYVEKLKKIEKGPHIPMTLEELDELLGLK